VGGNDFTLKAGDKAIDKILKKKAFAVMQGDELYVNCRNLRFEKTSFGKGYTKAIRMGENDLLLVNKMIGRDAQLNAAMTGFFFGAIGAALVAGDLAKQQVCYVISNGANKKGRITIQLIDDDHRVAIEVSDTGKGIRKKDINHVFTPGFTTKQRGWGLGLSLARRIVEDYHKGKIFVKSSEVGKGTTFRVELHK
jgi:light-regulated signal transduction histidine kinase (bacteriophytochrome)